MSEHQVEVAVVVAVLLIGVVWPLVVLVRQAWDKQETRVPYPPGQLDLTGRRLR